MNNPVRCKFSIVAMWDDINDIRHIRQCEYTMEMSISPLGLDFLDGMIGDNQRLFIRKIGYNLSSDTFEVLLENFLCNDPREYDRLFQLWEEIDDE